MIDVALAIACRDVIFAERRVREIVSTVLRGEGLRSAQIGVVFVDDRSIKKMNKKFLHHEYVTDVISFTLEDKPVLHAEVYVNLQQAKRQAGYYGVAVGNEVSRLLVHGTLHACGYNDRNAADRQAMVRRQEQYVLKAEKHNGRRMKAKKEHARKNS